MGKKVKCIRNAGSSDNFEGIDHLTLDQVYEVVDEEDCTFQSYYWVVGKDGKSHRWAKNRFEEVEETSSASKDPTILDGNCQQAPVAIPEEKPFDFDDYYGVKKDNT